MSLVARPFVTYQASIVIAIVAMLGAVAFFSVTGLNVHRATAL